MPVLLRLLQSRAAPAAALGAAVTALLLGGACGSAWADPPVGGATNSGGSAGARAFVIPLQCRFGNGIWQDCRMRVEEVGAHWYLLVGERQIEFRHDGRGAVTMVEQGRIRPVTSRWLEDRSLCWDGTCARGEIPLD